MSLVSFLSISCSISTYLTFINMILLVLNRHRFITASTTLWPCNCYDMDSFPVPQQHPHWLSTSRCWNLLVNSFSESLQTTLLVVIQLKASLVVPSTN